MLGQLWLPALYAGDSSYFQPRLSDAERERYLSEVRSDMALWEQMQAQELKARQRQAQYQEHLTYWEKMQNYPPARDWSGSESDWKRHVEKQVDKFRGWAQTSKAHLRRTQDRFQEQIRRMTTHQRTVQNSNDDLVRQSLGPLIGVAGMSKWVAPIVPRVNAAGVATPGRVTAGEITGAVRQGGRIVTRTAIGKNPTRLQNAGSRATNWGNEAATARGNLPTQGKSLIKGLIGLRPTPGVPAGANSYRTWEAVAQGPKNGPGEYVMRQVDVKLNASGQVQSRTPVAGGKTVSTGIAVRSQRGQKWIASKPAQELAQARAMNQQGKTQVRQGIKDIRLQAKEAAGTKTGKMLTRAGDRLEAKANRLDSKIEQYRSDNKGALAQRAKYMAGSAAKWAAFSAGMAVTTRAIDSYRQTGHIDWGYATQDLHDPTFWKGTGGAFLGSMAGSAIASAIPGGPLLRTAAAIGGAAVGFQWGSGNLAQTDWTQLIATTMGATLGTIMGGAFGPLGAIAGGMLGHWLASEGLRMLREWASTPSESYAGRGNFGEGAWSGNGGGDGRPGTYSGSSSDAYVGGTDVPGSSAFATDRSQVVELKRELDRARAEVRSAMERQDREAMTRWYQKIRELDQKIRAAR
jgi:hypothetical protein